MMLFLLTIISMLSVNYSATKLPVTKGAIFGGGRIGSFLYESNNKLDQLISRNSDMCIDGQTSGPIYVCTRNDDLNDVINKTPESRRSDLVFLQNGILEPFLMSHGLNDNTQGLIYFAISKKGETPIDGKTDLNPEGLTAITGKWGQDFANRLINSGLSCHVLNKEAWEIAMFEKLIWISAFMIIGAKHGGITVGSVESTYKNEVNAVIQELASAITQVKGIEFPPKLEDRLCAYARSVSHFPTALKEFKWRNGWFLDISNSAISTGKSDPSPIHTALLKELKPDAF